MKRTSQLFRVFAITGSVVLFFVIVFAWAHTATQPLLVQTRQGANPAYRLLSLKGEIYYERESAAKMSRDLDAMYIGPRVPYFNDPVMEIRFLELNMRFSGWELAGFGKLSIGGEPAYPDIKVYFFPHWFVALLTVLPPTVFAASWLKRRRRRTANCCTVCGYDLRASPLRCPECGAAPATENLS